MPCMRVSVQWWPHCGDESLRHGNQVPGRVAGEHISPVKVDRQPTRCIATVSSDTLQRREAYLCMPLTAGQIRQVVRVIDYFSYKPHPITSVFGCGSWPEHHRPSQKASLLLSFLILDRWPQIFHATADQNICGAVRSIFYVFFPAVAFVGKWVE